MCLLLWVQINNEIELKVFVPKSPANPPYSSMKMFKTISALTGIKFNFVEADIGAYDSLRTVSWGDKNKPDLYLFNNTVSEQMTYSQFNAIVPFNDSQFTTVTGINAGNLIENFMPHYKDLLDKNFYLDKNNHDAVRVASLDNGKMYSTLTVNDVPRDLTYKMYINQKWITTLNKKYGLSLKNASEIATFEEYYDILKAFKQYDVNENNNTNDEVPVSAVALKFLRNYILQSCGYVTSSFEINNEGTEFVFVPSTNAYREYLKKMKLLYSEGLLDRASFSMTNDELVQKGMSNRLGSFQSAAAYLTVGYQNEKDYECIKPITSAYYQEAPLQQSFSQVMATGAVIPSSSPYVRETARLLDLLYSSLGTQLIAYGQENEDWTWNNRQDGSKADGTEASDTWHFNVPNGWLESGKTQEDYRGTITPNYATANALYWSYDFVGKMDDPIISRLNRMSEIYKPFLKEAIPSYIKLTFEQYDHIAKYEKAIIDEVSIWEREFIIGDKKNIDLDSDWESYNVKLTSLQYSTILSYYNAAINK